MKSSYKKLDKISQTNKGYFGHPDLDAILLNSLCKGHLIILQQDHPTIYYLSLLRYFVSSNYHQNIPIIIYDSNAEKWKHLVSPVKKMEKGENKKQEQVSEIAWRYNNMEIKLNQLILSEEIKFLDLTREVENLNDKLVLMKEYPSCSIEGFYKIIEQDYIKSQTDQKDVKNKKILISSMPSYFYKSDNLREFLVAIRALTRSSHLTTLITLPPIISTQIREMFLMYTDYYFQIGKIGQGYTDFSASLAILKEIQVGQIKIKNRGVSVWGIKNKKKQLRIQSLYEHVGDEQVGEKKKKDGKNNIQF